MNKKFWYLTKLSFNKKVKSKWFIVTNVILLIAIVALLNISSIMNFLVEILKITQILLWLITLMLISYLKKI